MGIDAMARAALGDVPGSAGVAVRDVRVGPPVLCGEATPVPLDLRVLGGPETKSCQVTGPGGVVHFSAAVSLGSGAIGLGAASPAGQVGMRVTSGSVYPPYFHGPTFQVIAGAALHEGILVAQLATALPPLAWSTGSTVSSPDLLELCLQACGLWELATTGRMMIPSAVDQVIVSPRPRAGTVEARVRARPALADGSSVFDGVVVDGSGETLLRVEGYRTVDLGLRPELEHVARIRGALGVDRLSQAKVPHREVAVP
jgi:hypothetical protein